MQISNNMQISFRGLMDPNILITGASGYIGTNLVHDLTTRGYNCIVNSRRPERIEYLKRVVENVNKEKVDKALCSFVNLELLKPNEIAQVLKNNAPIDAVVHLAGASLNAESRINPRKYYDNNVGGTLNLVDTMLDNDVRRMVFISTGSTYGKVDMVPVDEQIKQNPETPYSRTKYIVEQILKDYETHGLNPMILRLFNVAGARTNDDIEIGRNFISVLMEKIKTGSLFTLMGGDYPTKDKTCVKDFLHVIDACNAIGLSVKKLLEDGAGNVYNLGSGIGTSLGEIIHKSQEISGRQLQLRITDGVPTETPALVVDNTKICNELDWEPQFDINDILKSSWEWTLNNGN